MIEEAYVSFEVAKLLKEKGFDEKSNRVYQGPNLKYTTLDISPLMCLGELGGFNPKQLYITNSELGDIVYTAPTQQMAMAWLRKKGLHINITYKNLPMSNYLYYWNIVEYEDIEGSEKTYEEAVEAALKYCLKNFI